MRTGGSADEKRRLKTCSHVFTEHRRKECDPPRGGERDIRSYSVQTRRSMNEVNEIAGSYRTERADACIDK